MTFGSSGTGTGIYNSIPEVPERERNGKKPFLRFENGKGMKKSTPNNREWEWNEKWNGREREFPVTPGIEMIISGYSL